MIVFLFSAERVVRKSFADAIVAMSAFTEWGMSTAAKAGHADAYGKKRPAKGPFSMA